MSIFKFYESFHKLLLFNKETRVKVAFIIVNVVHVSNGSKDITYIKDLKLLISLILLLYRKGIRFNKQEIKLNLFLLTQI